MAYIPPPEIPPAFPDLRPVRGKTAFAGGVRKRWKDPDNNIYEWDYQHGAVEMYDRRGRHLGEFDADTGERLKPADSSRRIGALNVYNQLMKAPPVKRMLRWFNRHDDELVGEEALDSAQTVDLARAFGRPADDLMYASYEVGEPQRQVIQPLVSHVLDLDRYAYFIEADAVPLAKPALR